MINGEAINVEGAPQDTGAGSPWYLADGVPGSGEKPEFLDSRYKSLSDQAKAYKELEKRFSAISGAPDEYDLGSLNDIKSDPTVQELLEYAKANKLSQEGVGKFFDTFNKLAPTVDLAAEKSKLGENADQLIEKVANWANNTLSDKAMETIGRISDRAEVVELLNELRLQSLKGANQPVHGDGMNNAPAPESLATLAKELQEALQKGDYDPRSTYADKLRSRMEDAAAYEELRRGNG